MLFDLFSANLQLYTPEDAGLFVCALCLRTFSRDQIRSELSRAHIVPQFLGGRAWTLACRSCNNTIGSEIESCESERANFNWALCGDGNETTRVRVIVRNEHGDVVGPVQADMRGDTSSGERRLQMYLQPKGSNPVALELLNNVLSGKTSAGSWEIEGHFRETRSAKRANLTYVHAAYLLMFHQFGYEWVFSPGAECIRKQIMSPDEPILLPLAPALSGLHVPSDEMAIVLVTEPADWRRFLVVLPLIRGWKKRQALWMPLFGCQYDQPPQRKGVELSVAPVPDCHCFLHQVQSKSQGRRFVLSHFAYNTAE